MTKSHLFVALVFLLAPMRLFAADWDAISIRGYSSFEFEKQITEQGEGDPNYSFDADLIDLVMNFRVHEKLRAAFDVTWEHGAASEDGRGNVALEYGFVELELADWARVRAGKIFTPFGIFNEIHTAKPTFLSVKEAASTNKPKRIVGGAFRYFPRWATGIALGGDVPLGDMELDYDLMISNGEQETTNPYEEDNNSFKAVAARARLHPTPDTRIGVSAYWDRPRFDGLREIFSFGAETELSLGDFNFLAEVVLGRAIFRGDGTVEQIGFFVQPSYRIDNVTPYLRLEMVDLDLTTSEDHGYTAIAGVNVEIVTGLWFKGEYNHLWGAGETSLAELPNDSYGEVKAALVAGF